MNNFTCKRCGQCCGVAPFTRAEYKAARRTAEKLGVSLVKQYIEETPYYIPRSIYNKLNQPLAQVVISLNHDELECPFLGTDKDGKCYCRIYELRPGVCRIFGTRADIAPELNCPNQNEGEE
jgi:Fe-S-cluster containining protein